MKNLKMLKLLSLLLAALLLFAACGQTDIQAENSGETAGSGALQPDGTTVEAEEEEPEGNGRSEIPDSLPPDLDFGGAEVRVFCRAGDADTAMEFIADELNGEVVNDAVHERNSGVEERLDVKIVLLPETGLTRHSGADGKIRPSVQAGSNDYDLIANAMYNTMPMITENLFLPLNKLAYLEFSKPWYNPVFLEATNLNGNNYAVMGDLSQSMISGSFVMFFNKNLLDEYFKGAVNLYETVREGRWTIDEMSSLCSQVYTDANGNGKPDDGDVFGHFFTDTKTLGADSFSGASKLDFFIKNDEGHYVYNGDSERMVSFTEKMHRLLFEDNNTLRTPNNNDQIMDTMLERHTIFTTWMLSGINFLRDMTDDFGIIPMPKLDEAQEIYTAYAHDGSSAFTIPVTEPEPDRIAAFLELMSAESYRRVTPAHFETAIKTKYSRDSSTSRMLDLVVEGIYLDFSNIFGQSLNTPIDTIRGILASSSNCENAMSTLTKIGKAANKSAEKVEDRYMKLLASE
ncbi:MAG: hypothetical protein K6A33_11715 [Clostridiales bacterium]|nr:hypothetical protein [Clostridiales bacterium]